ncbi:MAG: peptidylprolyl isomerase [Eubacteriaceae bacterium]
MKLIKKLIPMLVILALTISTTSCSLIQVDPEKDMQRIVFKTSDEKIQKKEFVLYLTYYELMYKLNGYEMPVDDELQEMKEDLLNKMTEIYVLKKEAIDNGYEVDATSLEENANSYIEQFLSAFEDEESYIAFIEERYLTREEFEEFIKQFLEDIEYANAFITEELKENSGEELGKVVAVVDKENLTKDEFYYKLCEMEFYYYTYYGQGLPTDEESLLSIYDQIIDDMVEGYLIKKDAEAQKITLKDDDIQTRTEEIKSMYTNLLGEDELDSYLEGYYLNSEKFDLLINKNAKVQLYQEALSDDIQSTIDITDSEIEEYYNTNKSSYDESTVSAKHILTESEDLANQISGEITDADSFEVAFEKYEENEEVSEAADLGEFTYTAMVTEFSEAAFGLDVGGVSEPVLSDYGYHIIYVYDKNMVEIPTLEEKKEEIKNILLDEKTTEELIAYIEKLVNDAQVDKEEIIDPFETYIENLKENYKIKTYPKRLD